MKILSTLMLTSWFLSGLCLGQVDPRVLGSKYEPVESLPLFKDSFIAAFNTGNRDFIKSMVLDEAVVKEGQIGMKFLSMLLPPHFNTHEKIIGLKTENDALEKRLQRNPDSFNHLSNDVTPITVLTFLSPSYINDKSEFKTYYSFLVVAKDNKLYIGSFNDKKASF